MPALRSGARLVQAADFSRRYPFYYSRRPVGWGRS